MQTSHTHRDRRAWPAPSYCLHRALSRARAPEPLTPLSSLGPGAHAPDRQCERRMTAVISARSSGARPHDSPARRCRCRRLPAPFVHSSSSLAASMSRSSESSKAPATRNARVQARLRRARSRHPTCRWMYAPRPASRCWGSGMTLTSPATTRSNSDAAARARQPTQVRTGPVQATEPEPTAPERAVVPTFTSPLRATPR